jgi:hypothetical protein
VFKVGQKLEYEGRTWTVDSIRGDVVFLHTHSAPDFPAYEGQSSYLMSVNGQKLAREFADGKAKFFSNPDELSFAEGRDDVWKLPIPRAAKLYARRSGLRSMMRQPDDYVKVNAMLTNPGLPNKFVSRDAVGKVKSAMKENDLNSTAMALTKRAHLATAKWASGGKRFDDNDAAIKAHERAYTMHKSLGHAEQAKQHQDRLQLHGENTREMLQQKGYQGRANEAVSKTMKDSLERRQFVRTMATRLRDTLLEGPKPTEGAMPVMVKGGKKKKFDFGGKAGSNGSKGPSQKGAKYGK